MAEVTGIEEFTPERVQLLDWFVAATRLGRDRATPVSEQAVIGANSGWASADATRARISFLERGGYVTRELDAIQAPVQGGTVDGFYASDVGMRVNKEMGNGEGPTEDSG